MSANIINNIINKTAFIRTSRSFPKEVNQLAVEVNQAYVDIAQNINSRTIGTYPVNFPSNTGNEYFLNLNSIGINQQQSLRQVYTFTSTSPIDLGFKLTNIYQVVNIYGTFTDGTNIYGLIQGSNVAIAGQVSFYLASTVSTTTDQITFLSGAGAPTLTSGIIIIEWT